MFSRKPIILAFALTLFLAVLHLGSLPASAFPGATGLDVDTVISDPFAYTGEITVRGGVLGIDREKGEFWMIDYREYKGCGVVTCALKSISVKSAGSLPAEKDVVEVKGAIEKNEAAKGGFILKATEVKVKK